MYDDNNIIILQKQQQKQFYWIHLSIHINMLYYNRTAQGDPLKRLHSLFKICLKIFFKFK